MVKLLWHNKINAITAELCVRLKQPAYAEEKLWFNAWVVKVGNRVIYTQAECKNSSGCVRRKLDA